MLDRGLTAERGDRLNDCLGGDGRERSQPGGLHLRSQTEREEQAFPHRSLPVAPSPSSSLRLLFGQSERTFGRVRGEQVLGGRAALGI